MGLKYNKGKGCDTIQTVQVYFPFNFDNAKTQTTNIYMTDDDIMYERPADLGLKIYNTEIRVPAEMINIYLDKINRIECFGYDVGNTIKRIVHYIETFKIDSNCNIYDYNSDMENMIADLEDASKILLGKHKMDIMRLKD